MERLRDNWQKTVSPEDYVIINGDISWATYIEQAQKDFEFISSLNGTKLISKGNHDYWWTTKSKLYDFLDQNNFADIKFIQNDCYMMGDYAICATRGWQSTNQKANDNKMFNRELIRLQLSLDEAKKQSPERIIVAMHYPPNTMFMELLSAYNVSDCLYGHLHAKGKANMVQDNGSGINYHFVSCDFLNFEPKKIYD